MIIEKVADSIIESLVDDIRDRAGLGDEWDQIDRVTKKEIRDEWKRRIVDLLVKG